MCAAYVPRVSSTPHPHPKPAPPQVTEAEREKLTELCANFTEWLEEVEAKQAELPLHEAPAYLSSQVTTKRTLALTLTLTLTLNPTLTRTRTRTLTRTRTRSLTLTLT